MPGACRSITAALKAANWDGLKAERDRARKDGRLVGLGLAFYVEVCGLGPSSSLPTGGWEHGQVTIERDGRITATTGASPLGPLLLGLTASCSGSVRATRREG
jgi:carbon-monoxide dehydrogenase large subunit